jgi:deoxyadenosine/deoxycytidine kinase
MKTAPILWIEGIIGAGKSTLADRLAEMLGMRAIHEPVETNPYLEPFYADPKRWAWGMQLHLMVCRYGLQKLAVGEAISGGQYAGVILDRGLPGDRVFAKLHVRAGNIHPLEWETYEAFYNIMACDLRPPSLIVFLDVDPRVAHERVLRRGRRAEAAVTLDYLKQLHQGYLDLLAEIESGDHAWSRGMQVLRWPWNVDHQSPEPLARIISQKFGTKLQQPETASA